MTFRDIGLGLEALELADIGAGDEAFLLARHEDNAADALVARTFLDRLDDGAKLLQRPASERVLRLALNVEDGPGHAFEIDLEAPVF